MINSILKIFLIIGFLFLTGCNYSDYDNTGTETIQDPSGTTLTMYVYDSGFIVPILDGVATIFDSDSGLMSLFGIGILFSLIIMMVKGALTGKYDVMSFLAGLFLFSIMFVPKVNVAIEEYSSLNTQTVANVPWGAAVVGTFSTNIGKSLTNLYNQHFTVPNMYETGFISPLKIITDIIDLGAADTVDANGTGTYDTNTYNPSKINNFTLSLNNYMRDCVIKDMYADTDDNSNRVITREKIAKSPDTWAALKVPHDGITWNTTIYFNPKNPLEESYIPYVVTCAEAYDGTQNQTIYGDTSAGSPTKGLSYFMTTPSSSNVPGPLYDTLLKKLYLKYKPNAAQMLIGSDMMDLSSTIASLFGGQANAYAFMKNSYTKWAFEKNMAETSTSALVTYQAIKQRQIQLASERSLFAEMALPTAAFLQALIFFAAPIIAFAMLLGPMGIGLAGKYLQLALWVSTWDVMMSIINLFTFTSFQKKISEMMAEISNNSMPEASIASFDNIEKIYTEANSFLAVASNLAAATPIITYALLTGTAYSLVSAINRVTSSADHTNEKLAAPDLIKSDAGAWQAGANGGSMSNKQSLNNGYSNYNIAPSGNSFTASMGSNITGAEGSSKGVSLKSDQTISDSGGTTANVLNKIAQSMSAGSSSALSGGTDTTVGSNAVKNNGVTATNQDSSNNGNQFNYGVGGGANGGFNPLQLPAALNGNLSGNKGGNKGGNNNEIGQQLQIAGGATATNANFNTPGGVGIIRNALAELKNTPNMESIFGSNNVSESEAIKIAKGLQEKVLSGNATGEDAAKLGAIAYSAQQFEDKKAEKEGQADESSFKDEVRKIFNDTVDDIKQSFNDMNNTDLPDSQRALAAASFASNFIGGPAGAAGKIGIRMGANKAYDVAQRILKNTNASPEEKAVAHIITKAGRNNSNLSQAERTELSQMARDYRTNPRDGKSNHSIFPKNSDQQRVKDYQNPNSKPSNNPDSKGTPSKTQNLKEAYQSGGLSKLIPFGIGANGSINWGTQSSDTNTKSVSLTDALSTGISQSKTAKLSDEVKKQVQASVSAEGSYANGLLKQNTAQRSLSLSEDNGSSGMRIEKSDNSGLSFAASQDANITKAQATIGLLAYNYEQMGANPSKAKEMAIEDYNNRNPNAVNALNDISKMQENGFIDIRGLVGYASGVAGLNTLSDASKVSFDNILKNLSAASKSSMIERIAQISGFDNDKFQSEFSKINSAGGLKTQTPAQILNDNQALKQQVGKVMSNLDPSSKFSGSSDVFDLFKRQNMQGITIDGLRMSGNGEQVNQASLDNISGRGLPPAKASQSLNNAGVMGYIQNFENRMHDSNGGIDYNSMFNARGMVSAQNEGGVYMSSNAASRALQLSMVGTALTAKENGTASDEFVQSMLKDAANVNTNVSAPKLDSNDSPAQQAYKIMQSGFDNLAYEDSMKKTKDNAYNILSKPEEKTQAKTGEKSEDVTGASPAPLIDRSSMSNSLIPKDESQKKSDNPSVEISKNQNGIGLDGKKENPSIQLAQEQYGVDSQGNSLNPVQAIDDMVNGVRRDPNNPEINLNDGPVDNALPEAQKKNETGSFVNPLPRKDEEDIQSNNRISNLTFDNYNGTMTANGAPLGFGNKIKLNNEEHYEQTKTTFNPSQVTNEIDIGINDTADPIKSVQINGQWHMVVEENGVYTKINLKDNG